MILLPFYIDYIATGFRSYKTTGSYAAAAPAHKSNSEFRIQNSEFAISDHPVIWDSTSLPLQYFSRSAGFSILPVGLRGTLSKMTLRGLL